MPRAENEHALSVLFTVFEIAFVSRAVSKVFVSLAVDLAVFPVALHFVVGEANEDSVMAGYAMAPLPLVRVPGREDYPTVAALQVVVPETFVERAVGEDGDTSSLSLVGLLVPLAEVDGAVVAFGQRSDLEALMLELTLVEFSLSVHVRAFPLVGLFDVLVDVFEDFVGYFLVEQWVNIASPVQSDLLLFKEVLVSDAVVVEVERVLPQLFHFLQVRACARADFGDDLGVFRLAFGSFRVGGLSGLFYLLSCFFAWSGTCRLEPRLSSSFPFLAGFGFT
eukprot:CAMPEP_0168341630 /NCGR_PEP_ID=MMETSP0213-20121227/14826_1 /TAXON_ID=151035 /ORGANISM="Euplotes harpa, Strain FSP1.4" /LENGTH=278 /DNA_ID=CAMNT_0008348199 /DNA_START=279 /DNA_END=1111 /DNA_ORIENTATION=+